MKERFHGLFGLHLRHAGFVGHAIDNVELDHLKASLLVRSLSFGATRAGRSGLQNAGEDDRERK
jgi:hypothetical protein